MLKKFLKIIAIVFAILILLAFTLPYIFKGKILGIARQQVNKNLNARVDFSDVDLSLFRHFPRLAVGLNDLQVTGVGSFQKDTLVSANQIDIAVNLMSLFGGSDISIYSISIDKPRIHAIVNAAGEANWNITKPDTSTAAASSSSSFNMHLQSYKITDGYVSYVDVPGDRSVELKNLNHSGSGDFSADLFTLKTKTSAESASFVYSKIPWLIDAKTSLSADVEVDNKTNTYRFKTDDVHVNDMQLSTEGSFQLINDSSYGMDIKFSTPSTAFKTILSMIPSIYKTEFDKIKTSGTAAFNGFVKGKYDPKHIPAYEVNLTVDKGFFQYPDLPQPVKNIGIAMKIENPDGITDHTVVNISKGHIEFGTDPFDFTLLFKNPMTIQYLEAGVKGKLNLADVTRFVKLPAGTNLSGLLDANASAKGNLSAITKQQAGPFTANGFINISNLNYRSADFPQPIRNSNIQIAFQNPDGVADHTSIQVPAAHLEIGTDPVDFSIAIKTPVSNPIFDGKVKGSFNLANTKQFTTLPSGTNISGVISADISFSGNKLELDKKEYDKINASGGFNLKGLHYSSAEYPDEIAVSEANFHFNPKNITLDNAAATYLNTHYTAKGSLDNAIGFMMKDEFLAGNLDLYADQIDLNKLMGSQPAKTDSSKNKTASTPFAVPANLRFLIQATIDKLHYDKVDYTNLTGAMAISDEIIALKDVHMNALDGKLSASGFYSTKKDKQHPDISFTYDITGMDVQKTFFAFNTVQKIMPMGQFVDGKMNSQLSMTGKLNPDMMPDMNSLTGKGNLLFVEGVFKKFAPVEKLAAALHYNQLNGMSLKDIKFNFEFANGKVLVKPFHVKYQTVDMEIGGMHGFDQSIDYVIAMKVPRSMLGSDANILVNNLAQQATAKGIPVKLSDNINIKVNMVGTITNPQVKLGSGSGGSDISADVKQQADVFVKQASDSVKTVVHAKTEEARDSANAIKNQAIKDLTKDLGKTISGEKDSTGKSPDVLGNTQKNAEATLKNTFNSLFNKKKDTTKH